VSGNGCYIESMLPLPLGTVLRVDFWLESEHINVTAVVRTCDPGVAMESSSLECPAGKQRMQAYLDSIDPPRGIATSTSK